MLAASQARWRSLVDGFWLVPGAVALGFALLALALVEVDRALGENATSFAFDGDASAARGVLETVAGSLITVAGLAFSLTVVVLVLVSGQFTPRSVPAFLADRVNQATAGTFIGVFAYCLLVLRTVRDEETGSDGFVPELSVTGAVVLAVVAIGLLLYFIHHLGVSIQASSIVNRVGTETLRRIDELPDEPSAGPRDPDGAAGVVRPAAAGYVRHIALGELAAQLGDRCDRIRLRVISGDFVTTDDVLASVWPAAAAEDAGVHLRRAVEVGHERDLRQDVLYGIRQLAEIAMKGLSPGINDPTTAESAIGYVRAALERLAARPLPPEVRRGNVVAPLRTFEEYADGGLAQVGHYASGDAAVATTLLDTVASISTAARRAGREERLAVLAALADSIAAPALEDARTERDRERLRDALARATA